MIKRRSFLTYFSVGWLTTCFPVVLAACAPKSETQSTANTDTPPVDSNLSAKPALKKTADGFTVVGSLAELDRAGYLQAKEFAVAKDPANPSKLIAVNPTCPHKACTVKWSATSKKYDCPCHDAEFAADGKLLKGPATKSLATYPAKIVSGQVLVKI